MSLIYVEEDVIYLNRNAFPFQLQSKLEPLAAELSKRFSRKRINDASVQEVDAAVQQWLDEQKPPAVAPAPEKKPQRGKKETK